MGVRISWSPCSLQDLREIRDYIGKDNSLIVKAFVKTITAKTQNLKNFPQLGRVVPEQQNFVIRELIIRPYRLVYRYHPAQNSIEISRIWHAARGEPPL